MSEMRNLTAYFACFDGTGKSWEEVEPYYDAAFSKDVSIVTTTATKSGQSSFGYEDWKGFLKATLEHKADIQMLKLEVVGKGTIEYTAHLVYPDRDAPIPFASTGYFEGGKLVKIVPLEK